MGYVGSDTQKESELTGRAGLMYAFDFGLTPYISYSQAFAAQPGNQVKDNPFDPAEVARPAAPLKGEQFEVGFKYQMPGRPVIINAAYFDLKEENRLVSDLLTQISQQGATARIRGVELEAVGRVTENIRLMASYTYMDAKYEEHFNAFEAGTPVEGVPRHMAALWGVYTQTEGMLKGFSIGRGVRYIGESKDYGVLLNGTLGDGTPLGDGGLETGSFGQQILGAIQPLHFGWFGGLPVKILYGLLGLALTIVTHSGVTIWLARRRDKGQPAERWERIWAAVAWGQPLALAAAALGALLLAEQTILPIYLAYTILALVLALRLPFGESTARILRTTCAILICAVVAVHAYIWAARATDMMAWGVTAALLIAALVLMLRRRA